MKNLFLILFITFSGLMNFLPAQVAVDLETGTLFSGYNDVRIPGDTGTKFSLSKDLEPEVTPFLRARLDYTFNSRHTLSLLYAPLSIKYKGIIGKDVNFAGGFFPANEPVDALFRFNSYRLTYRYRVYHSEKMDFGLGFTGKIRDAEIRLTSDRLESKKTNVGFVPILNFHLYRQIQNRLGFLFEGDALAAPQGRAEDVFAGLTYHLSDKISLKAGYRLLEGGADNDEVYNFALVHYASVGLRVTF